MRVCFVAHRAVTIAAFLILFPALVGAGKADNPGFPKIKLAALIELPDPAPAVIDRNPPTSLAAKWRGVRERMRHERELVALCRRDPADCPSDAATQFMAVVDAARLRDGRALIGEINRAINLSVRPVPDNRRYTTADVWTSPLVTMATGQGDCEDYAIAKLAALWAAGVTEKDTRLVIVHDPRMGEDHALAMVRLDGRWLALDNRRFTLIEAAHLTYRPLFAFDGDNVRGFAKAGSWAELDDENAAEPFTPSLSSSAEAGTTPVLL